MKSRLSHLPILSIVLVLFACIHYEMNTPTSNVTLPGLAAGIAVLAVIAMVLSFRIFNAAHDACFRKGLIPERLHFRYDALIPVAIVAPAFKAYWQGPLVKGMSGKDVPQWIFQWSDSNNDAMFACSVIGIVLLIRILTLVRAIAGPPIA
jgi:hypothetical protein